MLQISDLAVSKELDHHAMANVRGGNSPAELFGIALDFATSMTNKVADVNQGFGLGLNQNNAGAVTNNQAIQGGNGIVYAPVKQSLNQSNWMDVFGIGNTSVN